MHSSAGTSSNAYDSPYDMSAKWLFLQAWTPKYFANFGHLRTPALKSTSIFKIAKNNENRFGILGPKVIIWNLVKSTKGMITQSFPRSGTN